MEKLASDEVDKGALGRAVFLLLVAMVVHERFCAALATEVALDIDPINLVFGMQEFNVAVHAPHPPGYLLYVLILRAVHAVVGGDPLATVQLVARLFSTATIALVFVAVRWMQPARPMLATFAAWLTALHPTLLFHGADGQTHTSEAFAAALLLLALVAYHRRPTTALAATLGALLALGSAFRPSFVVVGVGPIIWLTWRRWPHLFVAGGVSVLGALAWMLPTFHLSGGYAVWKAAQDALVGGSFVRTFSLFGSESVYATTNLRWVFSWIALLLVPLAPLLFVRKAVRSEQGELRRRILVWLTWALVPGGLFYALYFCSAPGYFLGVLPLLVVFAVLGLPEGGRATLWAGSAMIALHLVVFALPVPQAPYKIKVPSLPMLILQETVNREFIAQGVDVVPGEERILVFSDFAGFAVHRQLPLLRDNADVMWVHSHEQAMFQHTSVSFATARGWTPVPGPVVLGDGPATVYDTGRAYHWVVVDMFTTASGRAAVAAQSACPIAAAGFVHLEAARCFPEGALVVDGHGLRFAVLERRGAKP